MAESDMKTWAPDCWITDSGIVCNRIHTRNVCSIAQSKAAYLTTVLIRRMMKP